MLLQHASFIHESATWHDQVMCNTGVSISDGYQLLAAKQGVDDQRFMSVKVGYHPSNWPDASQCSLAWDSLQRSLQ